MSKPIDYQIVFRARQLIDKESDWCTHTFALDASGCEILFDHPAAVRFCAWGSLKRAAHELGLPAVRGTAMLRQISEEPLALLNDRAGHAAIVRLFDSYLLEGNERC